MSLESRIAGRALGREGAAGDVAAVCAQAQATGDNERPPAQRRGRKGGEKQLARAIALLPTDRRRRGELARRVPADGFLTERCWHV
ncbi:hypothetical protein B296_00004113 [Ensete ventricosum]|uniref:Uncharacterized protein n=1 Tax=Ensete ventricosum TaxID=4639 RepID=A0A427AWH3_ENSVE|nr:hypothetical protein B296_00004113 [Ensete ventricosum]